jgi:hypothetical protein
MRNKGGFLVQVGEMVEEGKFKVKKFNVQNYYLWKMKMEDYLYREEYFPTIGKESKGIW